MIERIPVIVNRLENLESGQREIKQMLAEQLKGRGLMWDEIHKHSVAIAKINAAAHILYLGILACGGVIGFLVSILARYAFVGH